LVYYNIEYRNVLPTTQTGYKLPIT